MSLLFILLSLNACFSNITSPPAGISTPFLPGPARGTAVAGETAYVAAGAQGLILLDVSNPRRPQLISRCDTHGDAWAVAVSGPHAFVANGMSGLAVVDLSSPANPRVIGTLDTPGDVISLAVTNGYAYVIDNWYGLRIIDISAPASPVAVGFYSNALVRCVAVAGQYAYVIDNTQALRVVDVSDPAHPLLVGSYSILWNAFGKGVAVSGNYVFVAADYAGLLILDVTNPTEPRWAGACETPGFATGVTLANGFAYLACGRAGLQIVDVTEPTIPQHVGSFDTPGIMVGVSIAGSYAYAADNWAGVQILDVSQAANPRWASVYHTAIQPKAVSISSNILYVADGPAGLKTFLVEANLEPQPLGQCSTPGEAKGLVLSGDYAYVADGLGGIAILNVADPTNLQFLTSIPTSGEANALLLRSNYLFLADGPAGLAIYQLSDPLRPERISCLATSAWASALALAGDYAFVASGEKGLQVVDVSNPALPVLAAGYDTSGDARGIALSGSHAYVADGWAGLEIIDISEPANPRRAGAYDTDGFAVRVAIRDQKAFVADSFGIQILDVSIPSRPQPFSAYLDHPALVVAPVEGKCFASTRTKAIVTVPVNASSLHLEPFVPQTGGFGLRLTGPPGLSVELQASSNLTDWVHWQTVVLPQDPTNLFDTAPPETIARFYRTTNPTPTQASGIPQIILDSDIGVDSDDIGDLVLLHKLADLGLCNIVATIYAASIPWGAPALEAINIAYGRPNIPVATTKNPYLACEDYCAEYIAKNFTNTLRSGVNAPDAIRTYRQLLAAAPPRSITIIQAAYLLNLAELALSGPDDISPLTGEELLNEKVKLLAIAAGDYPSGTEVYFRGLPWHARVVVNRLKCPMIFSGDTLGCYAMTAHLRQLQQLFPTNSILRAGYEDFYKRLPLNRRETWAQNLILYTIYGPTMAGQKLYELEHGGCNYVDTFGGNTWRTDQFMPQSYLMPVASADDINAAITSLMYLPPGVLPMPYDPYVNLFAQLAASNGGTVNEATLRALDSYVKTLKADGTWDRKKLVWPCVGDNLNAALCLLKNNLRASGGALRLLGTTPTHYAQAEGLSGNGLFQLSTEHDAYSVGIRPDSCHLAVYSQTNVPGVQAVDCGRYDGGDASLALALQYSPEYPYPFFDSCSVGNGGRILANATHPTTGHYVGNRVNLRDTRLYRNQATIASGQGSAGGLPGNFLLIYSYGGFNTSRTLSHFSCGPGLNAQQLQTDHRALEELQSALGRRVTD